MTALGLDHPLHPDDALAIVLRHVAPLPTEEVPIAEAAERVLAADLMAPEDHPAFPASTMDGFAVIADDGSPWREIIGTQVAGRRRPLQVTPGTAVRIMTGAPLPDGADAVVPVEMTQTRDDHVIIESTVSPGAYVRQIGDDIRVGERLIRRGTTIGPAEIGLLATMGIDPVTVARRPRAALISTGDELAQPGQPIAPGEIRDSNRFSLAAAVSRAGGVVSWMGQAPDDRDGLERLLRDAIASNDLVITSGGVSMGELDLVKALLIELAEVHFRRVALKPGKPLNFATSGSTCIFGLPGNPVSALVSFELFIRPAMRRMQGCSSIVRPRVQVALETDIVPGDRLEFQRAILSWSPDGRLTGRPTSGSQASSRLQSFIGANGLLIIPPRAETYRAGDMVDALLTGELLVAGADDSTDGVPTAPRSVGAPG